MLLRAVEPLEGCQRPLLDSETPFLHIPEGRTRESEVGLCRAIWGSWPCLLGNKIDQGSLPPNIYPAHLPESPVSRGSQLKFPEEETATGNRFQLNSRKNFPKVSCLKLKGAT